MIFSPVFRDSMFEAPVADSLGRLSITSVPPRLQVNLISWIDLNQKILGLGAPWGHSAGNPGPDLCPPRRPAARWIYMDLPNLSTTVDHETGKCSFQKSFRGTGGRVDWSISKNWGGQLAATSVTFAFLSLCDYCDYMHAYDVFFRTGVLKCVAEAGEHSSRRSIGTCHLAGKLNLELDLVAEPDGKSHLISCTFCTFYKGRLVLRAWWFSKFSS